MSRPTLQGSERERANERAACSCSCKPWRPSSRCRASLSRPRPQHPPRRRLGSPLRNLVFATPGSQFGLRLLQNGRRCRALWWTVLPRGPKPRAMQAWRRRRVRLGARCGAVRVRSRALAQPLGAAAMERCRAVGRSSSVPLWALRCWECLGAGARLWRGTGGTRRRSILRIT
jgi:hypothetical protein